MAEIVRRNPDGTTDWRFDSPEEAAAMAPPLDDEGMQRIRALLPPKRHPRPESESA